ncbi:hypothetical protein DIS24_g8861 [Lasiodiplodia hormozganensis]|uniref:Aflatoxin regulatory protein domain-containing protein n=1 Tax=Lasiodiplodia hormozganensis TaxID=869390 RepID=A0AA39Y136_9PEZI|nr:hypothetical protein DIS24_g8861 [Lasiodiplodia hormozganensis]
MLDCLSSPTIPHGGGLAFSIGTAPGSNPTSGDSSMGIDGSCWYRPTPSATSATTTPHELLLAPATSPPTTDASGSTSEYATLPLEWFNIDIQTPICVSPPDERSGRSLLPLAMAAEEEALLPPRSPPGRGRGPFPGCESEGGLFLRDDGAACQCSEDAADAMAALRGGRVVTALDHVLRHTNAAMAVLARFLVCRGRHQESDLLLICFLAQKVVTAYRQALCTCGGASARNGSGVVQIPEIRVGSYRIVGEEGLLLMRQVVVVELRRLRRMVEQLREKMRDGGRGGCANAHSSSLLQGFLQAELKSVLAQAG